MRHKQWIYYNEWCEIFGNERAIGDEARNFESVMQEVLNMDTDLRDEHLVGQNRKNLPFDADDEASSETPTPCSKHNTGATSRSKKKKKSEDSFDSIASAINNLADITKITLSQLLKELTAEEKLSDVQDKVLCALQGIPSLTEEEQVAATKLLFRNHDDLALFYRLDHRGKLFFMKKLLNGD